MRSDFQEFSIDFSSNSHSCYENPLNQMKDIFRLRWHEKLDIAYNGKFD